MKTFTCKGCCKSFGVQGIKASETMVCPYCGSRAVDEYNACSMELCPPLWEFLCQGCAFRFNVEALKGPDEVKQIRCPKCNSQQLAWLPQNSEVCTTGG